MPRRFPIFQLPNRPLIVAGIAAAVASLSAAYSGVALLVSRLALLVWGLEELTSGVNWFRRLLGLAGSGYATTRLLEPGPAKRRRASGL